MRISVLIGLAADGNHKLLKSGIPKEVCAYAKSLTIENDTGFNVVRLFEQSSKDYRLHRSSTNNKKNLEDSAPKTRGRPKKEIAEDG
jgi:hypothetical protein